MGEVIDMFPSPEKKPEKSGVDVLDTQRELLQAMIEKIHQLSLEAGEDSDERKFYERQSNMVSEEKERVLFTLSRYQEVREEEKVGLLLYKLSTMSKKDQDLVDTVEGRIEEMGEFIKVLEAYQINDEAEREKDRRKKLEETLAEYLK